MPFGYANIDHHNVSSFLSDEARFEQRAASALSSLQLLRLQTCFFIPASTTQRRYAASAAMPGSRSRCRPRHCPASRVTNATEPCAKYFESPGPGWGEPEISDQTWHQIHLGPELGHIKIVHDVDGAEQNLNRLPDRHVQVTADDHDIVLPVGIVRIHTQRIVGTDVPRIRRAEQAVLCLEGGSSTPLLTHDLDLGRLFRDVDELVPYEQPRP